MLHAALLFLPTIYNFQDFKLRFFFGLLSKFHEIDFLSDFKTKLHLQNKKFMFLIISQSISEIGGSK